MTDPECPWWAKLRRADFLTDQIESELNAVNRSGAGWKIEQEADDDGAKTYRLRLPQPITADFAVLVGDAVHNLRSSLDQVAYHLAVQHSGLLDAEAERMSQYPIHVTGDKFDEWALRRDRWAKLTPTELYGEIGIRALRCAQPFAIAEEAEAITGRTGVDAVGQTLEDERANDATYVLNTLWNVDKHRRIPALGWICRTVWWTGDGDIAGLSAISAKEPLADGHVLAYDEYPRDDRELYFEFDLELRDSPAQGRRPLVSSLRSLYRSLGGWVIPRMLHVADGHEPPMLINFAPPRPRTADRERHVSG